MVAIFASATALLTPEFVGSFEPEILAAKFVQVEKEAGVKFNKTNSTFNIVGHWDSIQIAHKSLKKLVLTLEKAASQKRDHDEPRPEPQSTSCAATKENVPKAEDAGASEKVIPIKGNPKRGRHTSTDPGNNSGLPEPVVYFQYQDKSYMSEEVLNLDALLDAFEDNLPDTVKVKKEDLKKILEKNTENMGRPLEKRKAYIQAQAELKAKEEAEQKAREEEKRRLLQQQQFLQGLSHDLQGQSHDLQGHPQLQGEIQIPGQQVQSYPEQPELVQSDQSQSQEDYQTVQGHLYTEQIPHGLQQPQFQESAQMNRDLLVGMSDNQLPVIETTREELDAINNVQAGIDQALAVAVRSMNSASSNSSVSLNVNSISSVSTSVNVNDWMESKFSETTNKVDTADNKYANVKDELQSSDNDFGGETDDDLSYINLADTNESTQVLIEAVAAKSSEKPKEVAEKSKGKSSKRGRKNKTQVKEEAFDPMETSKELTDHEGSDIENTVQRRSRRKSKPVKYVDADKEKGENRQDQEVAPPPAKKKVARVRKVVAVKKQSGKTKKPSEDADLEVVTDGDAKEDSSREPLKLKLRPTRIIREPKRTAETKSSGKLKREKVTKDESKDAQKLGRPKINKIFKCTECEYTSHKRTRWTEHMGRVHGLLTEKDLERQKKSQFPCKECDKSFIFEKDLKRHIKIVHTAVSHFCRVCEKSYKSKYVYDKHVATHEEGYVRSMFVCQMCKREFTTKFSLANHIKSAHLGIQKTYMCPTCGKSFNQIRSYRQHANVHAGIKPYVCEICGKGFTYDSSLKDHRYMHDNIRRFSCKTCGKAFRQRTSLQIHMKVHKDSKDHICSSCGKGFTQKQSLIRHERIHTGDKPYSCMLCMKTFSDYAVIRRHMMMSHKKDKDEWNKFIISDVKRKSDHYIPGGPGYQSRDRKNNKTYVKAVDANVIIPREDAPPPGTGINIGPLLDSSTGEQQQPDSGASQQAVAPRQEDVVFHHKEEVMEQNIPTIDGRIQNVFAANSIYGNATLLPQQQVVMSSAKLVPSTSDPHQLTAVPLNYSIPQTYSANVQSNSPDPLNDENIVNHFLKTDPYRQTTTRPQQQKDMFTPVLAPLSAVAPVTEAQRTQVPFSVSPATTEAILSQAAGLAPWGYAGYPAYLNPANFAQFQGHQS